MNGARVEKCPICRGTVLAEFLRIDNFGCFNIPLDPAARAALCRDYAQARLLPPLVVAACAGCGHMFLAELPDQDLLDRLYRDHYCIPSPLLGHTPPARENRFLEHLAQQQGITAGARMLEIGSHDGYLLTRLRDKGFAVTGCEPGRASSIARDHGLEIYREPFTPDLVRERGLRFDLIISRFLLEHISDAAGFLAGVRSALADGGRLAIEVPDIEANLENDIIEGFMLQHCHYFTAGTLASLLGQTGFTTDAVVRRHGSLYAVAACGPVLPAALGRAGQEAGEFAGRLAAKRDDLQVLLARHAAAGHRLALWGAGGFTYMAFKYFGLDPEGIAYIVDSDPRKKGMMYLEYDLPVVTPERLRESPVDCIVVCSMFVDEIMAEISRARLAPFAIRLQPEVGEMAV